jgi:hypothetical protein
MGVHFGVGIPSGFYDTDGAVFFGEPQTTFALTRIRACARKHSHARV